MTRYAVRVGEQYLGRNRGHDYRFDRPGHDLVGQKNANLWIMKAHAQRVANLYHGTVVPVWLTFG